MSNLTIWLTPLWLLAVGVAAGGVSVAILWGLLSVVRPSAGRSIGRMLGEGALLPITYLAAGLASLCDSSQLLDAVRETLTSLQRLPGVWPVETSVALPSGSSDVVLAVDFEADELTEYVFASEQECCD